MWNMFRIIMDQSSVFNSVRCHLDLLSSLMRSYVNLFAFLEPSCREVPLWTAFHSISQRQRVNSLPSHYTKTKVSGVNCDAIKIVSLPTKRPDILQCVNQMWLVVHRHLGDSGCFTPGLFLLLGMKKERQGKMWALFTWSEHVWDGHDFTVQWTL